MNKKWLIVVIAVVLVGSGLALYLLSRGDKNDEPAVVTQQASENTSEYTVPNKDSAPPANEQVKLVAVGNYPGSGIATRTITGEYIHNVAATIGAPAEGKFYEGWIVGPKGFISTGKLTQQNDGTWSLIYSSDDDLSTYSQVVITEETEANGLDNVPEAHVLEGEFWR